MDDAADAPLIEAVPADDMEGGRASGPAARVQTPQIQMTRVAKLPSLLACPPQPPHSRGRHQPGAGDHGAARSGRHGNGGGGGPERALPGAWVEGWALLRCPPTPGQSPSCCGTQPELLAATLVLRPRATQWTIPHFLKKTEKVVSDRFEIGTYIWCGATPGQGARPSVQRRNGPRPGHAEVPAALQSWTA